MGETFDEAAWLRRYYAAPSEEEAREILDALLDRTIRPVAKRAVHARLADRAAPSDEEDVVQETLVSVVEKLKRGRRGEARLDHLSAYTDTTAKHACDEFYRRRFPLRYNVMKRVVTQLENNEAFYRWRPGSGATLGALKAWPPPPPSPHADRLETLKKETASAAEQILRAFPAPKNAASPKPRTAYCIGAALHWCEGALPIDTLVLLVQTMRDEFDPRYVEPEPDIPEPSPEPMSDAAEYLALIWVQIKKLPLNQRRTLLLNLRIDEEFGPEVFLRFGVASLREIAEALEIDPEAFEREILPDLPWTDRKVADLLDCTESQVSGLRSSARRTLKRRLYEAEGDR